MFLVFPTPSPSPPLPTPKKQGNLVNSVNSVNPVNSGGLRRQRSSPPPAPSPSNVTNSSTFTNRGSYNSSLSGDYDNTHLHMQDWMNL